MNDDDGMTRRESLAAMAGGALTLAAAQKKPRTQKHDGRMPSLFVAHGAPPLLDMPDWMGELRAWSQALPRPTSILMLSAHWEERPLTIGATRPVPLVYDFYGFPERYYRQTYPAPGAPDLAARVRNLVGAHGPVAEAPERGLDHGAYVPLIAMYPEADVPVLQVSLPSLLPRDLFALGKTLAPLRDEGVLIMGSGFITHNLRRIDPRPNAPTPAWASEFDTWTAEALMKKDIDALLDYQARAPGAAIALPTQEHFVPLLVAQGAGQDEAVQFPITGFFFASATKRSVQFG